MLLLKSLKNINYIAVKPVIFSKEKNTAHYTIFLGLGSEISLDSGWDPTDSCSVNDKCMMYNYRA